MIFILRVDVCWLWYMYVIFFICDLELYFNHNILYDIWKCIK